MAPVCSNIDNRVQALAEVVIRQTDDGAGAHAGQGIDRCFHLCRIDVSPPAQDHIAAPVTEVQVAVGIEIPHISEGFPAVLRQSGARTDIAIRGARPARGQHIDFTHLTRRQFAAIIVKNLEPRPCRGFADRTWMRQPLRAADKRTAGALAGSERLVHHLGAQPLNPRAHQPRWTGRTAGEYKFEGGHVRPLPLPGRQTPDALHHGGHNGHAINAMAFDQLETPQCIKAFHHHHLATGKQTTKGGTERRAVVQRTGHQHRVAALEQCGGALRIIECRIRRDNELGHAGAAAGSHGAFMG